MSEFEQELSRRLESLRAQGLYRELRRVDSPQTPYIEIAGKRFLNFSSNDYLGLAFEPSVRAAAAEAIQRYGAGSGASRLICGSLLPHHQLEEALADFKGAEAALAFSSGWATASGAICALMGKGDIIVLDKLVHASAVDASRLSGATLRVFAHNDMEDLESILRWCAEKNGRFGQLQSNQDFGCHRKRFFDGWRPRAAAENCGIEGSFWRVAYGGRGARGRVAGRLWARLG